MDGSRFDTWTRVMASGRTSRQRLFRLAAAAGLAAVLGAAMPSGRLAAARRCRRNGKPCLVGDTDRCCSGYCQPTGRHLGRCRDRPAAKGCTVHDNSCAPRNGSSGLPCPKTHNGRCFILRSGLPYCATDAHCFNCSTNDDCNRHFRRTGGHSVDCNSCTRDNRRLCVFA